MLYNLSLLTNEELQYLFLWKANSVIDALESKQPVGKLAATRHDLRQILDELDQRRTDGRLKDR
jgi:hypothetical protein